MQTIVTFLGTDSWIPGVGRDTASLVINGKYLVDTGWSAVQNLRSHGIDPHKLEYLFLTHIHHDHYFGLPQLLFYRNCAGDKASPPLNIVGPEEDLPEFMKRVEAFLWTERYVECVPEVILIPMKGENAFETEAFSLATCSTLSRDRREAFWPLILRFLS